MTGQPWLDLDYRDRQDQGLAVLPQDAAASWLTWTMLQDRAFKNLFRSPNMLEDVALTTRALERGDLKLRVRALEAERALNRVQARPVHHLQLLLLAGARAAPSARRCGISIWAPVALLGGVAGGRGHRQGLEGCSSAQQGICMHAARQPRDCQRPSLAPW